MVRDVFAGTVKRYLINRARYSPNEAAYLSRLWALIGPNLSEPHENFEIWSAVSTRRG